MSEQKIEELVELDRLYKTRPSAYRRKVLGLVGLGYSYVVLGILLTSSFVVGGILLFLTISFRAGYILLLVHFIKFALPAAALAGLLTRSIFVRIPKPEGQYLDGSMKTRVLEYFDDVRSEVGGRAVDDVVITPELNAAVQQLPRFGVVGPTRNYLMLGAPLLELMTPDEVRAVVAHEFGHLSHEHGRMSALVYRLDQALVSASLSMQDARDAGVLGVSFRLFDAFLDRFRTVTFAMRRGQEYEADLSAARATSGRALASALCRMSALAAQVDAFWSDVWQQPRRMPDNGHVCPYASLHNAVRTALTHGRTRTAVRRALAAETDYGDSHPALKDRLEALGQSAVDVFEDDLSAFEELFPPDTRQTLLKRLDDEWKTETAAIWAERYEHFRQCDAERRSRRAGIDTLEAQGLLELMWLEEYLGDPDAARETCRLMLERYSGDARAHFHWGRLHLDSDFAIAEAALLESADLDIELAGEVGSLLEVAYEEAGRGEDFEKFRPVLDRYEELARAAEQERSEITPDDEFVVPDLGEEFLTALRTEMRGYEDVQQVYLVEKPVRYFRSNRAYLLGFTFNLSLGNDGDAPRRAADLTYRLCAEFPMLGNPFLVIAAPNTDWLRRLDSIDGAKVYDRTWRAPRPPSEPGRTEAVSGEKILSWLVVIVLAGFFAIVVFRMIY